MNAGQTGTGGNDPARTEAILEHYKRIVEQQEMVSRLHNRYMAKKDESLAAKKNYDQSVNDLRELISGGPDDQLKLFKEGEPEPVTDWREVAVDRLAIQQNHKNKLRAAGIDNLGLLEELRAGRNPGFPEGLKTISGFGPDAVDKVETAMLKFIPEGEQEELSQGELEAKPAAPVADSPAVEEPVAEAEADMAEFEVAVEAEEPVAEAPVAEEPEASADDDPFADNWSDSPIADGPEKVRIKLTKDVPRMEKEGLVTGAEFDAEMHNGTAMVEVNGEPTALSPDEYQVLEAVK